MKPTVIWDFDGALYKAGFGADVTTYRVKVGGRSIGLFTKYQAMRQALKKRELDVGSDGVEIDRNTTYGSVADVQEIMDAMYQRVLSVATGYELELYMQGSSDYRKELWPLYKANRVGQPKPKHWDFLLEYAEKKLWAVVVSGRETDDVVCTRAYDCIRAKVPYVIVRVDKDIAQVPGMHYIYDAEAKDMLPFVRVSTEQAYRNFYSQVLTGDTSDNIPGIHKMGPVKAAKVLAGISDPAEMEIAVLNQYVKFHKGDGDAAREHMELVANLVYLEKEYDDRWRPLAL